MYGAQCLNSRKEFLPKVRERKDERSQVTMNTKLEGFFLYCEGLQ